MGEVSGETVLYTMHAQVATACNYNFFDKRINMKHSVSCFPEKKMTIHKTFLEIKI